MKNLTFLFVLVLSTLQLSAQDPVKKIHMGVSINPQMNLSTFEDAPYVEKENSFCLGVSGDIYFDVTPRLQIRSGLGIQYLTLNHRDHSFQWPHQGQSGEWHPDQSFVGYNTRYYFAGVPIYVKVKTQAKPNHFYVTGGVTPHALISYDGEIVTNEAGHVTTFDTPKGVYEPVSFFTTVGVGIGYERVIGKRKIMVEPNFQYSTGLFFKDSTVSSRANGHVGVAGIRMGIVI